MNSNLYKVALIGAGRIACGFDSPDSTKVLTHAHAISLNSQLRLAAIADTNHARGEAEAARWGATFFSDVDAMCSQVQPDIVVIATPDDTHAALLGIIAITSARLIVCEKPVCTTTEEAQRLDTLAAKMPIIVNFNRRFDDTAQRLARDIEKKTYGAVLAARGVYDRGIFHNGSHMLDLARMLFGELIKATPQFYLADFPEGAPSVSGTAVFERCPEFFLAHGDGRRYSIFELDILFEQKRFRFIDGGLGLEEQTVIADEAFSGFHALGPARATKTSLDQALTALYQHAVAVIERDEAPRSSLENALKTHRACTAFASVLN